VPTTSEDPRVVPDRLDALVRADEQLLIGLRRALHAHPELSGQESATTDLVEQHLRDLGLEPVRLAVGTGLVCDLPVGGPTDLPGPVVALRADIDALAMHDDKDVTYRSRVDGVAHACGHDVHTTILVGAARVLAALAAVTGVAGTVRLVFEPAEESVPGGAVDVIAEGWLDGVSAIFGLHCNPKLDVGLIGCRTGAITSAADLVEVRLRGPGGHTARPERTVDLVGLLGRLVTGLQPALDERIGEAGLLQAVFGAVHAGDAANVIPAHGSLRGTLRTRDHATWVKAPELVELALADVLDGAEVAVEVIHRRGVPPTVNTAAATDLLAAAAREALGADAVVATEQSMGGDSFAWYLDRVPGSYARLGVHDPASGQPHLDLHASTFDVDERAIGYGVRVLVTAALRALAPPS
jgi:amidohydrolase